MESQFNKFQSSIEDLNIESYPLEIKEAFYDFLTNVPYIKSLISPNRPYAKDCPRDEEGRIIVDLTNPPIIEDTDYFRPTAIHYQKYGCMTKLRPNPNPNSEYGKWVREETKRCFLGYVRPSDGAWITGEMYFFLNYCPIVKVKRIKGKQGIRVVDFPDFLEGQWLKFMYIHLARENAKHGSELASRGKGKSYCMASILAKRFILGEYNPIDKKIENKVESFVASYLKNYLNEDGVLNKFESYIDFCSEATEFPKKRLINSINLMHWQMGYKENESVAKKGSLNEVIGVSVKDSPGKLRGKRGAFIGLEEFGSFPNLIELYGTLRPSMEDGDVVFGMIYCQGCVCADTKVWTLDGKNIAILNLSLEDGIIGYTMDGISKLAIGTLITPSQKECLEITLSNGNVLRCSKDHPILKQIVHTPRVSNTEKRARIYELIFYPANLLKVGDSICEAREINVFGNNTLFDARLVGMLIGDGSYGYDNTPKFSSQDEELLDYVESHYSTGLSASHITKEGKVYKDIRVKGICPYLRGIGIYGQTKLNKRLPADYQILTYDDTVNLLGGLFDTDGSILFNNLNTRISITLSNKEILEQIQLLLRKLGIISYINRINPRISYSRKDVNPYYTLSIGGRENIYFFHKHIKFLVSYKLKRLELAIQWFELNPSRKPCGYNWKLLKAYKIISIIDIGILTIYNLSAICSRTYLANNIITHNTAGDKESDFSAALKIMYSPKAFNMQSVPNVYDKVGLGKKDFVYFYPAYVNRNGCYNKDGISDVTKAILEVLINRYNVKYNTTDANLITRTIAEHPIVPLEAIMRTRGNMFPVQSINERLNQLDNNPNEYDDVYIGNLLLLKDGTVKFSPDSNDIPIREYPLKDNKNKGAIEIYELPQKDSNGHVFAERYIIGHDPVDDDVSNTSSLTSTFVLDLLTDRIVAEYTGRQEYADSNFEIVRRLCIFYNAKCMYECHPYSLEVIKADGTRTTWQNIHIGDTLNSIGGKTTVVDIPFNLEAQIYKVTLKDGRTIMAGEDHAWDVIKVNCPDKWFTITTKQMLNYGVKDKYNRHIFYIPNAGRVDYPYLEVPIDPYTLGLLLAEGAFTKFRRNKYETFNRKLIQFSSSKEDASFYLTVIPYLMKYIGTKGYSWHLYIDNIDDILKSLGLLFCKSEDKFIPNIYLCNDYNTRLELLKGLMDGDGCASVNGAPVLVTSSKKLKDTVMTLCRSLGLNCSYKKKNTTHLPSYRISVYTDIPIFKLPRKVQALHIYRPNMTGSKANSFINKVAILSIEYSHIEMAKCITVDRHDGLYLIGDYVLTHNCNKKGIFSYFSKLNSLQWLAETPTYLKDLQIIKEIGYGNKAHPYDLKVYTPNGIKTWKDIKIGDYLYGINNNVTKVIDIPFDDITSIYKITLKDGRTVEASENHLWNIIDWNGISKVLSTKQILSGYYREKGKYREYKYYIKSNLGVEFKEQNIPLPSYFTGLMLGDGCFRNSRHHNACFTSSLKDMEVYKTLIPYEIKTVDDRHHWIRVPNIGSILQNLALLDTDSHTKFIPDVYKYNSRLNRLELLRGLLDTDGTIGYGGNAEYTTVSRHLANDIVEVARSLGINCNTLTHYNKYGIIYKVIFYTSVRLFNLPRKYNKQRLTKCRAFKTAIVNIEYIGEKMAKCVTVDSQDSSYLIGDFVATHNSRGVNATAAINAFADRLTREWLIKPVTITKSIKDSDELEVTLPNLMFVRSRAFLQELAAYNPQGNFDRIRAFGMLMIYRQEKIIMYQGDMTKTVNEDRYKDLAENDEFFRENYDDRFDDFEE